VAEEEDKVMVVPALERTKADVSQEVDGVEREPASAKDDNHGNTESNVEK
jgi:hypothetical protein